MNVRLLKKVKAAILGESRRFSMGTWKASNVRGKDAPPCRTMACIAGHADWIVNPELFMKSEQHVVARRGINALGLNGEQELKLCYLTGWPDALAVKYSKAATSKERAMVAAKRIDLFIRTHGKE
jgi:hypothetical protein